MITAEDEDVPSTITARASSALCRHDVKETTGIIQNFPIPRDTSRPSSAHVFLMQNHPLMILGTSSFLRAQSDILVVGSAKTPQEAFGSLAECQPNIIVFELSITGPFEFSHLKRLRRLYPTIPVLAYAYHEEVIFARRALQAGAAGYLMKEAQPAELATAIRRILAGETYLSERVKQRIEREDRVAREDRSNDYLNGSIVNSLSNRELQVFQFLGDGLSRDRIQQELSISPKTLSAILSRIRRKLGLKSMAALVTCAFHWAYYEGDFS